MRKILFIVLAVLFAATAQAQVTTSDLVGLGMPPELASEVVKLNSGTGNLVPATDDTYTVGSTTVGYADAYFGNGGQLLFDNAAGTVGYAFGVNTADETVVNAFASNDIEFRVNNVPLWTMNSGGNLIGAGTGSTGWTAKPVSADTCNNECATPCAFGFDGTDLVTCATSHSGSCVCAGAS